MQIIIGHGIDLAEVEEIRRQIDGFEKYFLSCCFTQQEIENSFNAPDKYQYYAGRFAAKESVMKAMECFLADGIPFTDIEIKKSKSGRPEVVLHGAAAKHAQKIGICNWMLSISHTKATAAASALAFGNGGSS